MFDEIEPMTLRQYVARLHELLPDTLPVRTAAKLAGMKQSSFRQRVLPSVRTTTGRVSLPLLEMRLGTVYGPLAYLEAVKALEPVLRRDRAQKAKAK